MSGAEDDDIDSFGCDTCAAPYVRPMNEERRRRSCEKNADFMKMASNLGEVGISTCGGRRLSCTSIATKRVSGFSEIGFSNMGSAKLPGGCRVSGLGLSPRGKDCNAMNKRGSCPYNGLPSLSEMEKDTSVMKPVLSCPSDWTSNNDSSAPLTKEALQGFLAQYSEDSDPNQHDQQKSRHSYLSVASSSQGWCMQDSVVIIVDFDDTIFPTTEMRNKPWFKTWMRATDTDPEIEEDDREMLLEFDRVAAAMVRECIVVGTLTCVTLAARPWVSRCLQLFLPTLSEVFEEHQVKVHYAREEKNVRRAPKRNKDEDTEESAALAEGVYVRKKMKAMQKVLKNIYGQGSWKNVLSIGDGPSERCALQDIGFSHRNPISVKSGEQKQFRIKTLKMLEAPTLEQLSAEVKLLESWIYPIVNADQDIDVELDAGEDGLQAIKTLMGDLVMDCLQVHELPVMSPRTCETNTTEEEGEASPDPSASRSKSKESKGSSKGPRGSMACVLQ